MITKELHINFEAAVDAVNAYKDPFPADILLKLYAYYKTATKNYNRPRSKKPIINAFKANALFQAQGLSESEAMQAYIDLVNQYFSTLK